MRGKFWRCLTLATLLAPSLLLAACSGPANGDASSPPPSASAVDPSESLLPSAPESSAPRSPSIAEQFVQRASAPDADPEELLAELRRSLSLTEEPAQADAMLRAMNAYYDGHLQEIEKSYEAESVQLALSALTFPITEAQADSLQDAEVRALVKQTVAGGYKLATVEGFVFPVVDYAGLRELSDAATPGMQAYLAIMAAESGQRTASDGGLAISREELLNRTLRTEAYLKQYTGTPEYDQVDTMYGDYLFKYLFGLPNTPVIDEPQTYRVLPEIEEEWRQTAAAHADTVTGKMTQRLLDLLKKYDGAMYAKDKEGQREDIPEMKAFREGLRIAAKSEFQQQ